MFRKLPSILILVGGFLTGLLLASMDHILPPESAGGAYSRLISVVDWFAPPLAGALIALALLYAQRARALHSAEKAAAEVLAERLAGTERRQAIWVVAAAIAHDLKNPLHNVQLLLEELFEEQDPKAREDLLSRVRENVGRAAERLGELSRAGQSSADQTESAVDLVAALDELHERLKAAAAANHVEISISCPRGVTVRADSHALRAAIENVAANAIESMGTVRGGKLQLRAEKKDRAVELSVEDDGPGIPDAVRARLFTPFSSGHEGTGLGLAIARALARAGGGDLICSDSRPGCTTFRFTFEAA